MILKEKSCSPKVTHERSLPTVSKERKLHAKKDAIITYGIHVRVSPHFQVLEEN